MHSVKGCRGQLKRPKAGKDQKDHEYAIFLHLSKLGTAVSAVVTTAIMSTVAVVSAGGGQDGTVHASARTSRTSSMP